MPVATCHKCLNQGCVRYIFLAWRTYEREANMKITQNKGHTKLCCSALYHNWPTQGTRDNLSRVEKNTRQINRFLYYFKGHFLWVEKSRKKSHFTTLHCERSELCFLVNKSKINIKIVNLKITRVLEPK